LSVLAAAFVISGSQSEQKQAITADRAIEVGEKEVNSHLLGNWPDVRLSAPDSKRFQPFQGIHFRVTVSGRGEVVDVALEDAPEPAPVGTNEGKVVVSKLHFRPFVRDGHPVTARFSFYVPVFPPEKTPATHVPFPSLSDRNSLVMTLERTTCYGTCAWYSLKVHGDGRVEYEGHCFVAERGSRSSKISVEAVDRLLQAFRNADYFSLDDEYAWGATDLPGYTTSISFDGRTKSVYDYAGRYEGMPESVVAIESAIDRETNSPQWTYHNGKWKPKRNEPCK
jgi:hypothetical protein